MIRKITCPKCGKSFTAEIDFDPDREIEQEIICHRCAMEQSHDWTNGDFGTVCLQCGASPYSLVDEVRERAIMPCQGRSKVTRPVSGGGQ